MGPRRQADVAGVPERGAPNGRVQRRFTVLAPTRRQTGPAKVASFVEFQSFAREVRSLLGTAKKSVKKRSPRGSNTQGDNKVLLWLTT